MAEKSKRQGSDTKPSAAPIAGSEIAEAEAKAPTQGWAAELKDADITYRANPSDHDAVLRLLKCMVIMRRWEIGKKVMRKAIADGVLGTSDDADDEKNREFQELRKHLERITPSRIMSKEHKDFCRSIRQEDRPLDTLVHNQLTFCNLNAMQYAAIQGHVDLFENLVALGAALDYPPLPVEKIRHLLAPGDSAKAIAPQSCTALLLICATLAMQGIVESKGEGADFKASLGSQRNQLEQTYAGQLEIAIQLVRMGADTSAVFDGNHGEHFFLSQVHYQLGLHGKTAFELAKMSKKKELIDVMIEFRNRDTLKKKVQCRCGSRLPFKICHACDIDEEEHLMKMNEGRLCFRYSPLAPCPCKHTKKTYYKCCWDGARTQFHNDRTGELFGHVQIPVSPEMRPVVNEMTAYAQQLIDAGVSPNTPLFPEMKDKSWQEKSKFAADGIRSGMAGDVSALSPKCRKFERDVYAGCIERIPNWFFWRDDHWQIDKPELLIRVREWNQALEQYCDAEGLELEERQRVVALHKASPLAPCGNPSCDHMEKEIKEFQRCGRCRKIGYCSRKCQAKHWKGGHKQECFA